MGLLDGFEKLINEHGSAAILKERIALANDKYAAIEAKVEILEAEKVKLQQDNERLRFDNEERQKQRRTLEEKLSHKSSLPDYVEEAGALFKKNPNGTYNETPYCPGCYTAMASPGRRELYRCGKKACGQSASFKDSQLVDVMARLP